MDERHELTERRPHPVRRRLFIVLGVLGSLLALVTATMLFQGCFKADIDVPRVMGDDGYVPPPSDQPANGADRPRRPPPSQMPTSPDGNQPAPPPPRTTTDSGMVVQAAESDDWLGTISGVAGQILGAERGILFYAYDTLAYPGQSIELVARIQQVRRMSGLAGVEVGFFDGDRLIDSATTDAEGYASVQWTPPKRGQYPLEARVLSGPAGSNLEQLTPQPLLVSAYPRDTRFVVVDLDHTVVNDSFLKVLMGRAQPMPDSQRVMQRIADKYAVIYLTHRPDLLTSKSKNWLRENKYPQGPLLVSGMSGFVGGSGEFKAGRLEALRKAYTGVEIGIGDKISDVLAYVRNDMKGLLIPHYKNDPEDMLKRADEVRSMADERNVDVVSNWREIEAAIFDGRRYSPEDYARGLERRASELRARDREPIEWDD